MNNQNTIVTLFSSNSTDQYIKDIFSVLALPRGSFFEFRYEKKYIDTRVTALLQGAKKLNIKALVAFRSSHNSPPENCFCIPIRWVRIDSVENISNGYSITFEIEDYPVLNHDFRSDISTYEKLSENAYDFFCNCQTQNYAVWGETLPIVSLTESSTNREQESWFEIVKKINLIPDYSDYHFFKCSNFYTEKIDKKGNYIKNECTQKEHLTRVTEGTCVYVDIEYYSNCHITTQKRNITVSLDENAFSQAKGLHNSIQSRYGFLKFAFQPKMVSNNTITEIALYSTSSLTSEIPTEIIFPIILVKNKTYSIVKSAITALGALLVASPGIIGDKLHIGWNILIAGMGVLTIGINNYFESKE